ncbi:YigZ family protein [Kangiella sediminilitoris]|uniref:IMPACT family member yvyE n=1 Tax=Kangiella sediminilitoris TaxID=1144748 RepID=A0A1B3B7H6_9GAMM|nr:YigZ family protein [Kangiella sediminilitoris]AOE48742.1 IMPACT family member yvyE [Kangiella sediminilitoris]
MVTTPSGSGGDTDNTGISSNMPSYRVPTHPVNKPCSFEEVIKGSRFITRIAFTPSVEQAKSFIKQLNAGEPDATHHCWSYIVGNPDSTTLIACSDDGEPSGTAGMPMLNVLQHSGLGDITAVVTRYYGGTKLGTGGLARAYSAGVKRGLELVNTHLRIYTTSVSIITSYDLQNQVLYLLHEHQADNIAESFSDKVAIEAEVPQNQLESFLSSIEAYENKQQLRIQVTDDSA